MKRKQKKRHLKVIPGKGTERKALAELTRRPLYLLLLFLALFLFAQIIVGWVWGLVSSSFVKTGPVVEGSYEKKFEIEGLITFHEQIVLAPAAGFVYYNVENGKRVPVGKKIATLSELPLEQHVQTAREDDSEAVLEQFKNWLWQGEQDSTEDYSHLFPGREPEIIHSPYAGVINLRLDGWEEYGPETAFLYLEKEEYQAQSIQPRNLFSGITVSRGEPLARIVDNHSWYFSAVVPAGYAEIVAGREVLTLYFDFEPGQPLRVQRVEMNRRSDGAYDITWRVDRETGDYLFHRWVKAEIVYDSQQGLLIPKEAYWTLEGRPGVFLVEHGIIRFAVIQVLAEKDDTYLVEGLNRYQQVVLNPARVREGQRYQM